MERWYVVARLVFASAWRRRWLLVATAWGVSLIGWGAGFAIPDSYESHARLYVDADAVLTPLLHGLAIDTGTANQLDIMQRTLLSRPNIGKLIGATNLNLSVTTPLQKDQMIQRLVREIKLTSEGRNLFTVTYRNTDPRVAHEVVAGLVNVFMEQANATNRADMANALKFVNQQIASYEVQLRGAEQRRAEFRRKYIDILPLESNGGVSRLDSARVVVREIESQLRDAIAKRDALQEEARITSPVISAREFRGASGRLSTGQEFEAAEARLTELRSRFTNQHPDVILAEKALAAMKAAPRQGPQAPADATTEKRDAIANPVYEQVKLRLIEAEGNITSLRSRLDVARSDLARMEELARAAPQVEAEHDDLDRGYSVLRKNYEELLARREASMITSAADTGADKIRLRVVDPPQVPNLPVAPDRFMLISIALLAGFGAAIALGILLGQMDQSISDVGHLRGLGFPVLGGISLVPVLVHKSKSYVQALPVAASIVILFIVYGGLASHTISHKVLF